MCTLMFQLLKAGEPPSHAKQEKKIQKGEQQKDDKSVEEKKRLMFILFLYRRLSSGEKKTPGQDAFL